MASVERALESGSKEPPYSSRPGLETADSAEELTGAQKIKRTAIVS